jgi:hypothetical protein
MLFMTVLCISTLIVLVLFGLTIRRLARPVAGPPNMAEWLENFSLDRYRPMQRLLSEMDYEFLATQAGYDRSIVKRLRSERRRIFRSYLGAISRDFERLHLIARTVVLYSAQDRPDLARDLVRLRFRFHAAIAQVYLRLALHGLGIGSVKVDSLLTVLDTVRSQLAAPTLATGQAAA